MSLESKIRSLKAHPLIQVLADNGGNPRTLVLIEPLWGVPYNLIAPFATLYMYTQGITDVQIGLILSVTMAVQVLFSFLGGILSDKLGRKFTTMMGDFFGWGLACLVWAVSNNFWLFLAAAILNCFEQINQTAWYCLLIEDAWNLYLGKYWRIGGHLFCAAFRSVRPFVFDRAGSTGAVFSFCADNDPENAHHLPVLP